LRAYAGFRDLPPPRMPSASSVVTRHDCRRFRPLKKKLSHTLPIAFLYFRHAFVCLRVAATSCVARPPFTVVSVFVAHIEVVSGIWSPPPAVAFSPRPPCLRLFSLLFVID